jgi:phosphoesterase RecJ-like protein
MFDKLSEKISSAKNIAIIGHKNPDPDSFGSVLGLCRLIEINFGKKPACIYDGNIPEYMDFLPGRKEMIYAGKLPEDFHADLLIVVDVADADKLIGDFRKSIFDRSDFVVKIDHHPVTNSFGDLNIENDSASAAAEMIFDMAKALNWKIDADAANSLLAGIVGDTGQFLFARSSAPLTVSAELIDLGARMDTVIERMNAVPKKHMLASVRAVANAEFYKDLAIAIIPRADYKQLDGSAIEVIEMLRRVREVEYIAVLTQSHEDSVHVSLRGRTKRVNEVARNYFGGGGHKFAAGGMFYGNIVDAKEAVRKAFGY